MSEACVWRWIRYGALLLGASGAALLAFSFFYDLLPTPLDGVAVGFHLCLGLFWLASGILYALRVPAVIVGSVLAGILWVVAAYRWWEVPLAGSQMSGILVAAVVSFAAAAGVLGRRAAKDASVPRRQSLAFDLFLAWPHFAFGTFYYLFLFSDRLVAWSASTFAAPLSLQFRGPYETALTIALAGFILQVGCVLPATNRFFVRAEDAQRQHSARAVRGFNTLMRNHCRRALGCLAVIALAVSLAVYSAGVFWGPLSDPLVRRVSLGGLAGYSLLVVGLYNTSVLFRLARPTAILGPIMAGTAVNLALGYVLSRLLGYEWAVAGFVAGAFVYCFASSRRMLETLRRLDYHYFRSTA